MHKSPGKHSDMMTAVPSVAPDCILLKHFKNEVSVSARRQTITNSGYQPEIKQNQDGSDL